MTTTPWVRAGALALCGLLLALQGAGCRDRQRDLLVVSTADCQGYVEPCG